MKTIYEMTVQELLDAGFNVYASKLTQTANSKPWLYTDAHKMEMLQGLVPNGVIVRGWFDNKIYQSPGAQAQRRQGNGAKLEVSIS